MSILTETVQSALSGLVGFDTDTKLDLVTAKLFRRSGSVKTSLKRMHLIGRCSGCISRFDSFFYSILRTDYGCNSSQFTVSIALR